MAKFIEFKRKNDSGHVYKDQRVLLAVEHISAVYEHKDYAQRPPYTGIEYHVGDECYVMVQGSYDEVVAKIREAVGDVSDMPEESVC